ncbi:hypothetical protein ACFCV3_31230 [Kribbella sp. NPDC056345]|uniref:hypothetical protein n=1 Tax=Kribbella sp. NPDC056345 TaxID=3345789 RepID=UPI0035D87B38
MSEGGDVKRTPSVARNLLDFNTDWTWRWFIGRVALFGLGSFLGGVTWELLTGEAASDRGFIEKLFGNVYIWVCLIATGLFALSDRRSR